MGKPATRSRPLAMKLLHLMHSHDQWHQFGGLSTGFIDQDRHRRASLLGGFAKRSGKGLADRPPDRRCRQHRAQARCPRRYQFTHLDRMALMKLLSTAIPAALVPVPASRSSSNNICANEVPIEPSGAFFHGFNNTVRYPKPEPFVHLLSKTVFPTPRKPVSNRLFSDVWQVLAQQHPGLFKDAVPARQFRRREPAPGEKGFLILSMVFFL